MGERFNATRREAARQRLLAGLCAQCGRRPLMTYYYCAPCLAAHKVRVQVYQRRRIAAGRCYRCGRQRGVDRWRCEGCRERNNRERQRARALSGGAR